MFYLALLATEVNSDIGEPGVPAWLTSVLAVVAAALSGFFAYLGAARKSRADKQVGLEESAQARLETLLEAFQSRLSVLEEKVQVLERENSSLERENATLRAQVRADEELLYYFATWVNHLEAWVAEGSPSPPGAPAYPWQVQSHLSRIREPPTTAAD